MMLDEQDPSLLAQAAGDRRKGPLVATNDAGFLPYDPNTDQLALAAKARQQAQKDHAEEQRQGVIKGNQDTGGKVGGILGTIVGSVYGQPEAGNMIGKTAGSSIGGIASGSLQDKDGHYTFDSIKNVLDQADMGQGLIDMLMGKKKKPKGQLTDTEIPVDTEGLIGGGADAGSLDLGSLAELGADVA